MDTFGKSDDRKCKPPHKVGSEAIMYPVDRARQNGLVDPIPSG
jgi:hypothetical protein